MAEPEDSPNKSIREKPLSPIERLLASAAQDMTLSPDLESKLDEAMEARQRRKPRSGSEQEPESPAR